MNYGTYRNFTQREAVADLRSDAAAGSDYLTNLESLRGDDISLLAILILYKGDTCAAVRIVLDGENGCRAGILVTTEVDDTVHSLVTATDVTYGHLTGVVASACALERLQQ